MEGIKILILPLPYNGIFYLRIKEHGYYILCLDKFIKSLNFTLL